MKLLMAATALEVAFASPSLAQVGDQGVVTISPVGSQSLSHKIAIGHFSDAKRYGRAKVKVRCARSFHALRRLGLDNGPDVSKLREEQVVLLSREAVHAIHK